MGSASRPGCSSTEVKRSAASHDGEEFPGGLQQQHAKRGPIIGLMH